MPSTTYVALLRGINVGGRNKVLMADLRTAFEETGHESVQTYIQSGNVVFASDAPRDSLVPAIDAMLTERFGLDIPVAVRSHRQLRTVVEKAPAGFGADPDTYHCDVIFLRDGLTPAQALESVETRGGVDEVWKGASVLYVRRLSAERSRSKLSKLTQTTAYQHMTIRNWRTTTTLLEMCHTVSDTL